MSWKWYLVIGLLSLGILGGFAYFQSSPGYMDAEYYYSMGLRIAINNSLEEPFIWNYLNNPASMPQAGFTFWMPLPALLAASGILMAGESFFAARIINIALATVSSLLIIKLAWNYTKNQTAAVLAGLMAVFPFLYTPFLTTTDSFGLMLLLGTVFFLILQDQGLKARYLVLGLVIGTFHLSRADGVGWLLVGGLSIALDSKEKARDAGWMLLGYLLVMSSWFIRNWLNLGEIMPASSTQMLWLTEYNDLFHPYPDKLSYARWFDQGIGKIFLSIWEALKINLRTSLFVQGQIILGPLAVAGAIWGRRSSLVKIGLAAWLFILVVMTVIFPFAGSRGGFFHSGTAIQPLIWVLSAEGFIIMINWGIEKRDWNGKKASLVLGASLILVLMGLTGFTLAERVIGADIHKPAWNRSARDLSEIAQNLENYPGGESDLVMLNNPPGYYAVSGRSAIVIPSGTLDDLLYVAGKYQARYLILDSNHPAALEELYLHPAGGEGLIYLNTKSGVHYFMIPE